MSDQENLDRQDAKAKKPGDLLVGKVLFDRFEVLQVLGESAMALVLKAREVGTNRLVAIKTVTPSDSDSVKRFAQEVEIHGSLNHRNIVEAIDSLEAAGGRTFFIMEFLSGMSLHRVLQTQTRLENEDELASILLQICDALSHAHQFGVLHRDLKPGNIFLLEQDNKLNVKVIDFGIAKPLGQQTGLTQAGYAVGSPLYMSPEQCRGQKVDFRSDVYSLGILAYEMTTGQLPYGGHNIMTVMAAHCDPDRKPQHLNTHVPELVCVDHLNSTIQTAMETDPAKRFQTISDFKASVQKWHDAVTNEFRSAMMSAQSRNSQPDLVIAVAEQQIQTLESSSTNLKPLASSGDGLPEKTDNGGPEQSQPTLEQSQPQPVQEQLTPEQLAEQQAQLHEQKLLRQQQMEQQQLQPQLQHQQMQRQQMKPLPPPPPEVEAHESPVQEQQLASEPAANQEQRVKQELQGQQEQQAKREQQVQREQQAQQEQQVQREQQAQQEQQAQREQQVQRENQSQQVRQVQHQEQGNGQPEKPKRLLLQQGEEPVQNLPAPDAVPPGSVKAVPKSEEQENLGVPVSKSGGHLRVSQSDSRFREQAKINVAVDSSKGKSKTMIIVIVLVLVLAIIAFLVLGQMKH